MNKSYTDILEEQLAIDYDCSVEEVHSSKNIFRILNKTAKPEKSEQKIRC